MHWFAHDGVGLHWREDGPVDGLPVVFLNSLGTDMRLWDAVLRHRPAHIRAVRMDTRGHGLSDAPPGAYTLDELADDALALLDHIGVPHALIVGVSLGGMTAQAMAHRAPDRVMALLLSNTGLQMGTADLWADRIAAVEAGGLDAIADGVLDRWFGSTFRASPAVQLWRAMLVRTPPGGYTACCAALAGANLTPTSPKIGAPTLVIAGSEDAASPPNIVRALADAIQGAHYEEWAGLGHLPMVEAPQLFADRLAMFAEEVGHA